ncbi:MAG: N-acetylmuramoyl-L-alanine amidase [Magnetospirillum sp.]
MMARPKFLRALMGLTMLAAASLPASAWARAQVSASRLGTHPDNVTRVVLDVSENLNFSTLVSASPDRILIRTGELDWTDSAESSRPFGLIRSLHFQPDSIVIDLREPALVKSSFMIPPRDGLGWRLVVDVQKTTRSVFQTAVTPVPAPQAAANRAIVVYSPSATAQAPAPVTPTAPIRSVAADPAPRAAQPAPLPVEEPVKLVAPQPPPAPATSSVVVADAPAPAPAPVKVSPTPAVTTTRPTTITGAPMLSAPVPPPLPRPIQEASAPAAAAVAPTPDPAPPAAPAAKKTEQASLPARAAQPEPQPRTPRNQGKAVVVIDPGHGGVDPGALGVSGIYEKHITLAMARELKAQLERSGRYKVHLTRDRDIFIRLRERVAIARQYGADLFISLHADSVNNPQLTGLSVYTLSQTASDGEAQLLADKENKADLLAGIDLSHESADVANILIDLAQRETMNRSAGFAGGVVDELGRETTLLGNTHRFAGFAVLKAPDVPSILIELGYLSNASEERQLRQPDYRAKLAKGIARAVDRHFLEGQKARRP